MEIIFDEVYNNNAGVVRLTKFKNGITLSTTKSVAPWYGVYETIFIKDEKSFILKGYDTLERAMIEHEKFTKMSEKELIEYDCYYA